MSCSQVMRTPWWREIPQQSTIVVKVPWQAPLDALQGSDAHPVNQQTLWELGLRGGVPGPAPTHSEVQDDVELPVKGGAVSPRLVAGGVGAEPAVGDATPAPALAVACASARVVHIAVHRVGDLVVLPVHRVCVPALPAHTPMSPTGSEPCRALYLCFHLHAFQTCLNMHTHKSWPTQRLHRLCSCRSAVHVMSAASKVARLGTRVLTPHGHAWAGCEP